MPPARSWRSPAINLQQPEGSTTLLASGADRLIARRVTPVARGHDVRGCRLAMLGQEASVALLWGRGMSRNLSGEDRMHMRQTR